MNPFGFCCNSVFEKTGIALSSTPLRGWTFSAGPSPSHERIGPIPLAPKKNTASQKRLSAVDPPPRVNRA